MKNKAVLCIVLMFVIMFAVGLPLQAKAQKTGTLVSGKLVSVSEPIDRVYKIPSLENKISKFVTVQIKTESGDLVTFESCTGAKHVGIGFGFTPNTENYEQISTLEPNKTYVFTTIPPVFGTNYPQIISWTLIS